MAFEIVAASEDHIPGIVDVINSHIRNRFNGILEEEELTIGSKLKWFEQFNKTGPYRLFVAIKEHKVIGYTCSFQYRSNKAFDKTIETSIYTIASNNERGVGTALYSKLFDSLRAEDLHLAVVGIALPNEPSLNIHKKFGFEDIGVFKEYIYHNQNYTSSMWMQKFLK